MSKRDDGGPAYPHHDSGDTGTRPGMSLRDHFAAHAPVTFVDAARMCGFENSANGPAERAVVLAFLALARYEYADAMLEERAK